MQLLENCSIPHKAYYETAIRPLKMSLTTVYRVRHAMRTVSQASTCCDAELLAMIEANTHTTRFPVCAISIVISNFSDVLDSFSRLHLLFKNVTAKLNRSYRTFGTQLNIYRCIRYGQASIPRSISLI